MIKINEAKRQAEYEARMAFEKKQEAEKHKLHLKELERQLQ